MLSRGEEEAGTGSPAKGLQCAVSIRSFVHSFVRPFIHSAPAALSCSEEHTPALPWRASGLWVGAGIPGQFGGWPRAGGSLDKPG